MTKTHFQVAGPWGRQPREMLLKLEFHLIPKCAPSKSGCHMTIPSLGSKKKYTVMAWITSSSEIYALTDSISSSNSPHNYEMVKETRKRWPRKESSIHLLCPFVAAPLTGMFGVSWHWQVGINPWQGSPFWDCLQSLGGTAKPQSRTHHLLHAGHVIHSHKDTVELVK